MNKNLLNPVVTHPPPWHLNGDAFIMNYWLSPALTKASAHFGIAPSYLGRMVQVMLVRYETSPVGPYDELLLLDHSIKYGGSLSFIPKIYVSTEVSVQHGQALWGIPKELAQFEWLERENTCYCQIQFGEQIMSIKLMKKPATQTASVSSKYLPDLILKIKQHDQSRTFSFAPQFSGALKPMQSIEWINTLDIFPDFSKATALKSFYIPEFQLIFPEAQIEEA